MAKQNWFERLISSTQTKSISPSDISNLQHQLDEALDAASKYEVDTLEDESRFNLASELKGYSRHKFLDADPSSSGGASGDAVGSDTLVDLAALQKVFATETWVYAAISTIAETIAALPVKVQKSLMINKTVLNEITGQQETIQEQVWVDSSGSAINQLFQYPNPDTTKSAFYMLLVIDLLSCGEYYIYLETDGETDLEALQRVEDNGDQNTPFGRLAISSAGDTPVKALRRLPPSIITPVLSEDRRKVIGYGQSTSTGNYVYKAAEIIHVKFPNPLNPFRGLSPLMPIFKPVLLDRYSTEHMIRFYKAGARLGGVITSEKSLNKEQLGRFQRSFENNFTGRQNHHRTLVLPPGMKYEQIEQNPAETALLEFCRYNREAILAAFKVPPIKVGIMDNANYANARVQLKTYFNDSVKPKLTFIEDGFNLKSALMSDSKKLRMTFDLTDVAEIKEDEKEKGDAGKLMLEAGLTINEVRRDLWNKKPIPGGDKSPVLERMSAPGGLFSNLAADSTYVTNKDAPQEITPPTDIKPTGGTYEERVAMIVGQLVQSGVPLPLAVPRAMEQARLEGYIPSESPAPTQTMPVDEAAKDLCPICKQDPCVCPPDDTGKDYSLSEFIKDALDKLDPNETPDAAFLAELVALFNGNAAESAKEQDASPSTRDIKPEETATPEAIIAPKQVHAHFSKEALTAKWKSFIEKTSPMEEKRLAEVRKFFREFERIVLNQFGENIKAYGITKARDNEDIDDILKLEAFQKLIKEYTKEVDGALNDAYKYGYTDTLVEFNFDEPNEDAIAYLEEYGAKEVTYITDTTKDQLREVLEEAFKAGKPVGEVTKDIRAKFEEISQGRAITIARTETLSAVSAGQAQKSDDFKEEFPDRKLMKTWISAQDDRVRDSHNEVDGEVVGEEEDFSNGLKYPRESGQEASEVINCRCSWTTFPAEAQDLVEETLNPSQEDQS